MTKILKLSCLLLLLTSCSTYKSNTLVLDQNVDQIPAGTVIGAISENSYKIPKGTQIVEKSGLFKTLDNTYDEEGDVLLIPRHAIIRGVYTNDGAHCKIVWKSIYKDMDAYYNDQGSFSLTRNTHKSECDPEKGVKSGDRVTIKFK